MEGARSGGLPESIEFKSRSTYRLCRIVGSWWAKVCKGLLTVVRTDRGVTCKYHIYNGPRSIVDWRVRCKPTSSCSTYTFG